MLLCKSVGCIGTYVYKVPEGLYPRLQLALCGSQTDLRHFYQNDSRIMQTAFFMTCNSCTGNSNK